MDERCLFSVLLVQKKCGCSESIAQPKAESDTQPEASPGGCPKVQPAAQPAAKADEESLQELVRELLPPDAPGLPAVGRGVLGSTSGTQESPKQATQKGVHDETRRIEAAEQIADGGTDKHPHEHAGEPNCQSVIGLKHPAAREPTRLQLLQIEYALTLSFHLACQAAEPMLRLLGSVTSDSAAADEHALHVGGKDLLLLCFSGVYGDNFLVCSSLVGRRQDIEHEWRASQSLQVSILAQC